MLHHTSIQLTLARLGTVALVAMTALACSYAKGAPYVVEGTRFPDDRVASIQEGMSADDVIRILGEPYEVKSTDDGVRWRYYVWQRQDETIRYLGFIPVQKTLYSGAKEATLFLRDGVVQSVDYGHKRFD